MESEMTAVELAQNLVEHMPPLMGYIVQIWDPDAESWQEVTGLTIDPETKIIKLYSDIEP
jgi:hypothetical protein